MEIYLVRSYSHCYCPKIHGIFSNLPKAVEHAKTLTKEKEIQQVNDRYKIGNIYIDKVLVDDISSWPIYRGKIDI